VATEPFFLEHLNSAASFSILVRPKIAKFCVFWCRCRYYKRLVFHQRCSTKCLQVRWNGISALLSKAVREKEDRKKTRDVKK
jgi:hypothetical protein